MSKAMAIFPRLRVPTAAAASLSNVFISHRLTAASASKIMARCPSRVCRVSNHSQCVTTRTLSGTSTTTTTGDGIVESAAATAEWKRQQFRRVEERFGQADGDDGGANPQQQHSPTPPPSSPSSSSSSLSWDQGGATTPLEIDSDEEVQPMWKSMEKRVTRRRSYTREERKGQPGGRRNMRKSDEDLWLEAGLYDNLDDDNEVETKDGSK